MNQTCKVCGEPAAGFHFGAFTCEGCKSFFGRSYNNLSSISECKNNGECVINKKNRTSCKACRLRKCLLVGMSKSGSRYGRRSNWFKIHCLLQEQQQAVADKVNNNVSNYEEKKMKEECDYGPKYFSYFPPLAPLGLPLHFPTAPYSHPFLEDRTNIFLTPTELQETPIDLSLKSSPVPLRAPSTSEEDSLPPPAEALRRTTPLDLTTKVQ